MSGLFGIFHTVRRGMNAQQTALQVVSHNVANANTEGYSVQRADLKTTEPFTVVGGAGQLGTGVNVAAITRARDEFLDTQIRNEKATLGRYETREEFLSQVETVFMEPSDSGLSTIMGKFWDAWSGLSTNPESLTSRTLVSQTASDMADTIKHSHQQLEDMEKNMGSLLESNVREVTNGKDGILEQIVILNRQIKTAVVANQKPNDLMDQRDLLLDKLSERLSFKVSGSDDFGGIKIEAYTENGGSVELLKGDNTVASLAYDGTNVTLDGSSVKMKSGSISGLESLRSDLKEYKDKLDLLAETIVTKVNEIHTQGGGPDFFIGGNTKANNIEVNPDIVHDPAKINAGNAANAGDGSRALQIAQLRNKRMMIGADTTEKTIDGYFKSMITDLGVTNQQAKRMMTNQEALLTQMEVRRESISGVSIDEEMTSMIQFQRAYEANAKMINVIDQLLDVVVNGLVK